MSWQTDNVDWSTLRSANSAEGVPEAIIKLIHSSTIEEAESAYWRIDNEVSVQGSLFEAAVSVAWCAAQGLLRCTDVSRPYLFELLVQLCSGQAHPSELGMGNENIADDCIAHAAMASVIYFDRLEHGEEEEIDHAIDLIGLCAQKYENLRRLAIPTFNRLLEREPAPQVVVLVKNWIADLSTV